MNCIKNERIKNEIIKNERIKNERIKNELIKKRTDPLQSFKDDVQRSKTDWIIV